MIDLQALGVIAGGLGLSLLGMGLMTNGLDLAAGPAPHRILAGASLLAAGIHAQLALSDMEQALRLCSALRRAARQIHKTRRRLADGRKS